MRHRSAVPAVESGRADGMQTSRLDRCCHSPVPLAAAAAVEAATVEHGSVRPMLGAGSGHRHLRNVKPRLGARSASSVRSPDDHSSRALQWSTRNAATCCAVASPSNRANCAVGSSSASSPGPARQVQKLFLFSWFVSSQEPRMRSSTLGSDEQPAAPRRASCPSSPRRRDTTALWSENLRAPGHRRPGTSSPAALGRCRGRSCPRPNPACRR